MKLTVISHKQCWLSDFFGSGYASDGGFPIQMHALSELFDQTALVMPLRENPKPSGETPLQGHNLSVVPLSPLRGLGWRRKVSVPFWFIRSLPLLLHQISQADAIHTPVPGDVGTLGMLLAWLLRKPLFVRHCGDWFAPRTFYERWLIRFMTRQAGGRNIMFATGGGGRSASESNPNIRWIFASTLTEQQLHNLDRTKNLPGCSEALRLILVGRQEPDKGTEIVIRSLPELTRHFPNIELDIVGSGSALQSCAALARDLAVDARVRFHGSVSHACVLELLQQAHVFCLPSASEGFPKAALEALACGLPVIASSVSVLPELLGNGGGVILEERTPQALVNAVIEICSDADRYSFRSRLAKAAANRYSLEAWQAMISSSLTSQWGELRAAN